MAEVESGGLALDVPSWFFPVAAVLVFTVIKLLHGNVSTATGFRKNVAAATALIQSGHSGSKAADRLHAFITGANSVDVCKGVGFALASQLLDAGCVVILGCRNQKKAEQAVATLTKRHKAAADRLHLLHIDVSSLASVQQASKEYQTRFARLDYLFCNAGMLPVSGSRYSIILLSCLFCQMGCFLSTGRHRPDGPHYLIVPGSKLSQDKVGLVFATNVLGHYALVNLMKPLLEASPRGRVMWTSSRSASPLPHVFHRNDVQHLKGNEAYGSSKFCVDAVSRAINADSIQAGSHVRSFTMCPGAINSQLAPFLVHVSSAFMKLLRPFLPVSYNMDPERGSVALLELAAITDARTIDFAPKYCTGRRGELRTVEYGKISIEQEDIDLVKKECDTLLQQHNTLD